VKSVARAFEKILAVVRTIPRGRVATYGEVAELAGFPRGARVAGYALRASKGTVPWQRVLGVKRRGIAHVTIKDPIGAAMQRQLLEREGVKFMANGGVDLERYGHRARRGRTPKRRARS
jgi:methylated-DNA-protein-cysteine methyltransferase-like protein